MNYKRTIIESFDSYIKDNRLENTILKSKRKGEYYIAHDYWLSLIYVSMNKWKTEYWIDMTMCFFWKKNMYYLNMDRGLSRKVCK